MINQPCPHAYLQMVSDGCIYGGPIGGRSTEGSWQLLFFYPRDFTFVCPTELIELSNRAEEFYALDTEIFAISTDSEYCHLGWMNSHPGLKNLKFPLVSDPSFELSLEPYNPVTQLHLYVRGTVLVNPKGIIKYYCIHDNNVGRSIDEILRVLEALQTDQMTPCGWRPGDKTLD